MIWLLKIMICKSTPYAFMNDIQTYLPYINDINMFKYNIINVIV